jgi:serine phosphatase RsbU (regulator of sigma subunit)
MGAPRDEAAADRGIVSTIVGDLRRTIGGAKGRHAHLTARRTLSDLEEFYLTEEHRRRLARAGWGKRWVLRIWWLFKGLVLKLSPARRLLLALGLLNLSALRVQGEAYGTDVDISFPGLGVALVLLVLALELRDKLVAHDELEAGRTVQKALMPSVAPSLEGWDLWFYTQSANEVSGDLVDALALDGGRTALVLADVAGKGLSAALLSAKLQATVRALIGDAPSLGDLGERVNHIMYRDGVRGRFATMVCLLVSSDSGRVRLLNAGHLAPLVLRDFAVEELPRGAVALGMVPSTPYAEQVADLGRGDTLLVYSDGVTEAMNAPRDFFGDDRLRALFARQRGRPAADAGRAIVDEVARFVDDAPVHDDVSLVVLRRTA